MKTETMLTLLKRQSPKDRERMRSFVGLSNLHLDRFIKDPIEDPLTDEQLELIEAYLTGQVAMGPTADGEGRLVLQRTPRGQTLPANVRPPRFNPTVASYDADTGNPVPGPQPAQEPRPKLGLFGKNKPLPKGKTTPLYPKHREALD